MGDKPLKYLAVLTVRNEAAFLLEWLAHHRATGFTDFLVFSNDCQDGTDTMLDRLAEMGQLTHVRNDGPYDKGGIQFTALKHADQLDIVRQADWIMVLDIDEFVNIQVGAGTLPALTAALPEATAITLTWRLFGSDGKVEYTDTLITETFTGCAPEVMYWPWRAVMFKTLYRNDGIYRKLGVHRPRSPDKARLDQARWFDCQGRELGKSFKLNRLFSDYGRPNYRLAQLNHYALGSMESFVIKSARGRVNHTSHVQGADYWVERNFSTDRDSTIQKMTPLSTPLLKALRNDPGLDRLHLDAVQWRHDKFAALMLDEGYRRLLAQLMMAPPSRPISAEMAKTMIQLGNKARRSQG